MGIILKLCCKFNISYHKNWPKASVQLCKMSIVNCTSFYGHVTWSQVNISEKGRMKERLFSNGTDQIYIRIKIFSDEIKSGKFFPKASSTCIKKKTKKER